MKITYNAPEGDNEVVIYMGVKFFNGQEQDLDPKKFGAVLDKAKNNPHFSVEEPKKQSGEKSSAV